jgi:glycosyltransferase 2 family protein
MRRLLVPAGIVISIVFLALALRGLNLEVFWADVQQANLWWLVPGIAVYFAAVWFRAWRWAYMLRPVATKQISAATLYPIVVIGYMGNNIYPARIGEVLRAYVLRRNTDIPMATSLATVVLERVIDGLIMVGFVLAGLTAAPSLGERTVQLVYVALALFAGVIAVFFAMALAPLMAQRIVNTLTDRLLPAAVRGPIQGLFAKFVDGARSLRSPLDLALIVLSTLVTWLLETVKYWCVAQAFGLDVSFVGLMLINGVSNLATIIPAGPGAIGTFDAGGVLAATALGVPTSLAQAYIVVLHVALWLPVTALGAYLMLRQGLRWADFKRASAHAP